MTEVRQIETEKPAVVEGKETKGSSDDEWTTKSGKPICKACYKRGHIARNCRDAVITNLIQDQIITTKIETQIIGTEETLRHKIIGIIGIVITIHHRHREISPQQRNRIMEIEEKNKRKQVLDN